MLTTAPVEYQAEPLSPGLWDEIAPLLEAHYHEIAHWRDMPLEPNREAYQRLSEVGSLRIYTARVAPPADDRGRLVGYLCVLVSRSLHYRSFMFANQDVLFIDKPYRGTRAGIELIRYAHKALRADGVDVLFQHVKHREDINIGPVLGRLLGYEHVDDIWAVRLDQES